MSDATLVAYIEAYDRYSQQFQKFSQAMRNINNDEKSVQASTVSVNEALTNYINSKRVATDAATKLSTVIRSTSKDYVTEAAGAKQVEEALAGFSTAQKDVAFTSGQLTQALLAQGMTEKEAAATVRQLDSSMVGLEGSTGRTTRGFGALMGAMTILYGMRQAMTAVMQTGGQFEQQIRQDQAVVGDMSDTLEKSALSFENSVHGPSEIAAAYYELGSAGLSTNEILASTPDVLNFATAGMIDMQSSAYAVSSTIKAFGMDFSQSGEVVDAFAEAVNRSALKAGDFKEIMATAGAVGQMAGQDFREVIAAAAALRDSGVSAERTGTSIKSALLALINPSKQAKDAMKTLGVEIYDSSGHMKQWHQIVADFTQALAPFNEQTRNMKLATIFGSDGIRAMAASMGEGNDKLQAMISNMQSAGGETKKLSDVMGTTYDGALKKVNSDLEKLKISLFDSLKGGSKDLLGALDNLVAGFNNLPPVLKGIIELVVGGAGLIVAIGALALILKVTLIPALTEVGITTTLLTGPVGIVIGLVAALAAVSLTAYGAWKQQQQAIDDDKKSVYNLGVQYQDLKDKLAKSADGTKEHAKLQDQLNQTMQDLGRLMPDIVEKWDSEGRAIAFSNQKLIDNIALNKQAMEAAANKNTLDLENIANEKQKILDAKVKALQDFQTGAPPSGIAGYGQDVGPLNNVPSLYPVDFNNDAYKEAVKEADKAKTDAEQAKKAADDAWQQWQDVKGGKPLSDKSKPPDNGPGSGAPSNADAAKEAIQALTDALYPYTQATQNAQATVSGLAAKEQYLDQVIKNGNGTVYDAIELQKTRATQLQALSDEQTKLHTETNQQRQALASLQQMYADTSDVDAQRELRNEIDRVTKSIQQNGLAWWQAEQQRLSLNEQVKADETKQYTDAYQQAQDLMRHQVNMAEMSTEQQIEFLRKLRDAYTWTTQQLWSIDEDLYRLRKQQLSSYMSTMETEYKSMLSDIDKQISALDSNKSAMERESTTRKHNETLANIQEQYNYESMWMSKEHQDKAKELKKQIDDENASYQQTQADWELEDKKAALEKQRTILEQHYQQVTDIANKGALDTLAALAAKDPQWLEIGKTWIQNLIDGITAKEPEFQAKVNQATSIMQGYQAQQAQSTVTSPSMPGTTSAATTAATAGMTWQEELEYFKTNPQAALTEIARAGQVYTQKKAAGDTAGADAAHQWANQIRSILGLPSYDKGGPVLQDQLAMVHKGEYVLNAYEASNLKDSMSSSGTVLVAAIEQMTSRIVMAISQQGSKNDTNIDKLLNIENYNQSDQLGTGPEDLSRILGRAVLSWKRAGG